MTKKERMKLIKESLQIFNFAIAVMTRNLLDKKLKDDDIYHILLNVFSNGTAGYFSKMMHGQNFHSFTDFYMKELMQAFIKAKKACPECGNLHNHSEEMM